MRDDRIGKANPQNPDIVREATTYQDYLDKYALYRSDPAQRKVHQKFPMIMLWDDHEVQDNYAGGEADGGLPAGKHYTATVWIQSTNAGLPVTLRLVTTPPSGQPEVSQAVVQPDKARRWTKGIVSGQVRTGAEGVRERLCAGALLWRNRLGVWHRCFSSRRCRN